MSAPEALFWSLALLLIYLYVGYALVMRLKPARPRPAPPADFLPTVTLFVCAHNEEPVIAAKIENSLRLDYPEAKLEIVIASDGSDDRTVEIAGSYRDPRLVVHATSRRGGKNSAVNQFVPRCKGEILVLTDANAEIEPGAIRSLARHFADPRVGLVTGNLRYVKQKTSVARGEGIYFRYESGIKRLEGRHGAVVAAAGALYAIRAADFVPLDLDVPNDLAHPIQVAARGQRLEFEPEAVALERATEDVSEEFDRRARIVTRGLTAFLRYARPYRMLRGLWGYCFVSHKLLRWFTGFYLGALLFLSALLATRSPVYRWIFYAQVLFYGLALAGLVARRRAGRLFAVPFYFTMVNAAAILGVARCLGGRREAVWETAKSTR